MKIGLDVSLTVCKAEGYAMLEVNKHHFNKAPLTTDCDFSWTLPEDCRNEESLQHVIDEGFVIHTAHLNYNDLFERYEFSKEGIDSFVGEPRERLTNPSLHDVLHLASDIHSYEGL